MPLNEDALVLAPSPRSVKDARRWVSRACARLERNDLLESAELGVSELVTNAILHGNPPLSIRMRGTRQHPRVEVFDGSQQPPRANTRMTDAAELLSTVGRGLAMVALCSDAWGSYIQPEGKIVWFEPADGLANAPDINGEVFTVPGNADAEEQDLADGTTVVLQSFPINVFLDFRRHYNELRRELRLLSLAHESDYPVAKHVTELFQRSEEELRGSRGSRELEAAMASGRTSVDLTVVVPPGTPRTMEQMVDMLELADEFCRSQRLLSLSVTPQQRQFQHWFFGEFARQGNGAAPLPWAGGERVKTYSQSAS